MNFLTSDQMGGIVRAVVASAGGYAAAKGWIGAGDVEWLAGGAAAAFVAAWSWWSKRPKAA